MIIYEKRYTDLYKELMIKLSNDFMILYMVNTRVILLIGKTESLNVEEHMPLNGNMLHPCFISLLSSQIFLE